MLAGQDKASDLLAVGGAAEGSAAIFSPDAFEGALKGGGEGCGGEIGDKSLDSKVREAAEGEAILAGV